MKGAHPDPLSDEPFDAVTHFLRGLVCERNSEDIKSRHTVLDQVRDPVGENARLSAAGPGQNKQRPNRRP